MGKVAQCDSKGFCIGVDDDYGGPLPHNCYANIPEEREGFIARRAGDDWEYIENHIGETGWVDGKYTEIKVYGPLPDNWSTEPPPPPPDTRTIDEKRRSAYVRDADPILAQIEGYRAEAAALRLQGSEDAANEAEAKIEPLLLEYLAKKQGIREQYKEETS